MSCLKHMLETLCESRKVPDTEFFLNRRDFPLLRKDFRHPYSPLAGNEKVFDDTKGILPIFSMCSHENFIDSGVPTWDDWARIAFQDHGIKFNTSYLNRLQKDYGKIPDQDWDTKIDKVVFRGSSTGEGVTIDTNPRLKVCSIQDDRLDVGITSWNLRPRAYPVVSRRAGAARRTGFSLHTISEDIQKSIGQEKLKKLSFSIQIKNKLKGQAINNITTKTPASKNLKSIILMIIGMGCLTLADLLIKIASQTLPLGQVMIVFGVGSITVFLGLMNINGESVRLSPFTNPAVVLRNLGDLLAINGMCLALVFVPISTIGAVIQTVPLMVTAAAALFLGEKVGLKRVSAIFIGFLGTLFIVQPGAATFDITTTFVLIAAVGMALRDISTKLVRESFSTLLLSFYSCVLFILSGSVLLYITGGASVPDINMIVILATMITLGSLGFFFMTGAVRLGDMSVVIPFRYTRILFSVAAGILILGEEVNAFTVFGSALTILSGLYIWRREIVIQASK